MGPHTMTLLKSQYDLHSNFAISKLTKQNRGT